MTIKTDLANLKNNRLMTFAAVGAAGFVVDAGVLQILFSQFKFDPLIARFISFPLAVTATWLLNRVYTFKDRFARTRSHYWLYLLGQTAGALINVATFALLVRVSPALALVPIAPLAIASGVALFFNYAWANKIVFRRTSDEQ